MISYKNKIVLNDLQELHKSSVNWKYLKDQTILITGATGMLASYFTFMLLFLNEHEKLNIRIRLLARNREKLIQIFGEENEALEFIVQDVCDEIDYNNRIDFIFHAAGAASPYYIIHDPVGIIKANTLGTLNVLELARKTNTKKVLFTSTREVYGKLNGKKLISEDDMGILDPLDYRSCYPESKRMAENMFKSYSLQHKVHFNILRIAHVYGPGIQIHNDGRVMGDLINDAINNRQIHLKSDGKAIRAFCYITDALEAIFRILINGKNDDSYNIANETEPVTILELADLIQEVAGNKQKVVTSNVTVQGYCNYERVRLATEKSEALEWKPQIKLSEGIKRTITSKNKHHE